MKKYKYLISKALVLVLAAVITSCSIDDIQPINHITDYDAIRDETTAQMVLNGIYDFGRGTEVSTYPLYLAAFGDEGVINGRLAGGNKFNTNEVQPDNRYLANLYNSQYKIINLSNFLISELEAGSAIGISEERKVEMIAEAKFQRAFAHFTLLRLFGQYYDVNSSYGIVIKKNYSTEVESLPRATVRETYDFIISDLETAAAEGPKFVEHVYTGSLAAKALLAKVQLYAQNFSQAALLAQEVIENDEGYALEQTYDAIFALRFNSSEVIYAPFAGPGSEGGSGMNQIKNTTYSQYLEILADAQVDGEGSLNGEGENFDPRFQFAYADATAGVNGQGKYPFAPVLNSEGNTIYHLRMAEIYLIHAEAIVRSGGDVTTALADLNTIRARAGVTEKTFTDNQTLLEDIRQEKLLELFFENGEPLNDLVRFAILDGLDITTIKPTMTSESKYILPLPLEAVVANNALVQNPGY